MKIWNIVSAILIIVLVAQFSNAISANIGEGRVTLKPEVTEGETLVIERVLHVINKNPFDVTVAVTTSDTDNMIELIDKELTLAPNETKEAKFNIYVKYGGNFKKQILASFTPVDSTFGTNSVGMISNIFIYAKGPAAPASIVQIPNDTTTPAVPNDETTPVNSNETQNTTGSTVGLGGLTGDVQAPPKADLPKTTGGKGPSALIGIITVVAILVIGLVIFFLIIKSGVLK